MSRTLMICGYGSGISSSVARHFGEQGFALALVARSSDKLEAGVATLREAGLEARAFTCDLGDPDAVATLVADVRSGLGPITAIHWNAYVGAAGDLTTCSAAELRQNFDVGVTGLVVAVQAALPDLEAQGGAVLITGGGFAKDVDAVNANIVNWNCMGLGLTKAAQHKLAGVLHHKLAAKGVYVGEVVVLGAVAGTAFARGGGGLDPDGIAAAFWRLYSERDVISLDYSG